MLIAQVMAALAAGEAVDVTEGQQTRDFLYVADLVAAIVAALTEPGAAGAVLDVGSGEAVTVRECLERIERLTGRSGLVRYGARAYSERETFHYAVDPVPAREALGWEAKVGLDEGLKRVWIDTQSQVRPRVEENAE
jgi:nucleoside-diphosphate-sugar epimerase